jgi:hypothetical protein
VIGCVASEQRVQYSPEGVDVGAGANVSPPLADLLRSHVGSRSSNAVEPAGIIVHRSREPEIRNADMLLLVEHEVGRFKIAMNNPGGMGVLNCFGGLDGPCHGVGNADLTSGGEIGQIGTGKMLHDDEAAVAGRDADPFDADNALMIQSLDDAGFPQKPSHGCLVPVKRLPQELDRDLAAGRPLAVLIGYISLFFLDEPAKHGFKREHSAAVLGGAGIALFGTMLLGSLYMWTAYYVERFTITGSVISIRSMLQNCQFDISELQALKWQNYPAGGGIRFRILGSKARLDLNGYSESDRLRIVRALRGLVPSDVQEGWPMFCHKVALPLRDGKPSIVRREPNATFYPINRKRYDRILIVALPLSVALAIGFWLRLKLWEFAAMPFLVIAAWLLLRFNVPAKGRTETRLTSTSHGMASIIGMGGVVLSQLLMIGLALLGVDKSIACWTGLAVLLATFPPMLFFLHKADKQRRIGDEQAAELAPLEWMEGGQ